MNDAATDSGSSSNCLDHNLHNKVIEETVAWFRAVTASASTKHALVSILERQRSKWEKGEKKYKSMLHGIDKVAPNTMILLSGFRCPFTCHKYSSLLMMCPCTIQIPCKTRKGKTVKRR